MVKEADRTGFEVDSYDTEREAVVLGRKINKTLKIRKSALRKMSEKLKIFSEGDDNNAIIFMLGGKKNLIGEVIQFPDEGDGCTDTSYVSPQKVASAAGTLIAIGERPLGFGVVRRQTKGNYYSVTDSLVNNLKTWRVLFPGCYVILLAHSSQCAWHLEKKGIKRVSLWTVKDKTTKKGGEKNGRKKNHRKSLLSRKKCGNSHGKRKVNRGRRPGKAKNRGKR